MTGDILVHQREPHPAQALFINSRAKRKVIRAGRRGGKTTGIAHYAVERFLRGKRVLYATPTADQIERFWHEVKLSLEEAIDAGIYSKNETKHIIELPNTEQRIRAKTAWNADTLRGDFADELIFDEWQLMNEECWDRVGAPMLLDNDGDVTFIYTPPSLHSRSTSKATDPRHAAKLYKKAEQDKSGRWECFTFTSKDNPYISKAALSEITKDMTAIAYRMEILAEDIDESPGALWSRATIESTRVTQPPDLYRIVVAVDPQASTGQTGIVVVGVGKVGNDTHGYVLEDATTQPGVKPQEWGAAVVSAYHKWGADAIVAETNHGGDMIEDVIRNVDGGASVRYIQVRASRGKYTRAEPISAIFSPNDDRPARGHMVGTYPYLEDELCNWVPGDQSPNRLDAMVWGFTETMIGYSDADWENYQDMGKVPEYESRWT